MTKYTTTSLIKELEKFPKDLPIDTELECVYNYDDEKVFSEVLGVQFENEEEMFNVFKKYTTRLAIFEGNWEDDNISDLNNIMPEYVVGWTPEHHCNNHAILKEDIITKYFQILERTILNGNLFKSGNDEIGVVGNKIKKGVMDFFMRELDLMGDIKKIMGKIEAQKKMCKEEKVPLFAPPDGLCFNCGKQIYNLISMEEASSELITHCPYCGRAYND